MEQAIIDTRKKLESTLYAQIGALNIRWHLEKQGLKPPPISTINKVLKRGNLVRKRLKYEPKGTDYPVLKVNQSNFMHQFDVVGPRYLKTDGRFYSANIIDAYDRRCCINPVRRQTKSDILASLVHCFQILGIPDYLQMDNKLPMRGSNWHPHSFGLIIRLCLYLGIQPIFIPIGEPWRNGIIERFQDVFDKMFFRSQYFMNFSHLVCHLFLLTISRLLSFGLFTKLLIFLSNNIIFTFFILYFVEELFEIEVNIIFIRISFGK